MYNWEKQQKQLANWNPSGTVWGAMTESGGGLMFKNNCTNIHDEDRGGQPRPSIVSDKLVEKNQSQNLRKLLFHDERTLAQVPSNLEKVRLP